MKIRKQRHGQTELFGKGCMTGTRVDRSTGDDGASIGEIARQGLIKRQLIAADVGEVTRIETEDQAPVGEVSQAQLVAGLIGEIEIGGAVPCFDQSRPQLRRPSSDTNER